jgi:hypothetical protein
MSIGFVAFIVGNSQVGLYSPSGKCQYTITPLPPSPIGIAYLTMSLLNKQVLACGGTNNKNCYIYDVATDKWSIYSTSNAFHTDMRGVVHQGKVYLTDNTKPEVFDPVTKTWSTWTAPPFSGGCACFVSWKNVIFRFGPGNGNYRQVLQYDPTTKIWTTLTPSNPPMDLCYSGCAVLPNMNVLLAGSVTGSINKMFAVFNVTSNTWPLTTNATVNLYHSKVLVMGSRVFIIPHYDYSTVIEYNYFDNTASNMSTLLNLPRPFFAGAIAAPAVWFSHLPDGCIGVY